LSLQSKYDLFAAQLPAGFASAGVRVVGHRSANTPWTLAVPGSKSVTNRALILAGLAAQPLEIQAPLLADDTWWGCRALEQLGFRLDVSHLPDVLKLEPPLAAGISSAGSSPHSSLLSIHLGQAGTLARFFPALLVNWQQLYPNVPWSAFELTADPQLMRRPLSPLLQALNQLGAQINDQTWPIVLRPAHLQGQCRVDGSQSGQFLSGLLLAAGGARTSCEIIRENNLVQPDYVRITAQMLRDFGVALSHDMEFSRCVVHPGTWNPPAIYKVEADASTACYFAALACVLNLQLTIENLGYSTLQPDFQFIKILNEFGACVEARERCTMIRPSGVDDFSTSNELLLDMTACSDQAMTAGVMSLCSGRPLTVTGVSHIRHHESDRIAAFCRNCAQLGVEVEEFESGFRVRPPVDPLQLVGDWPTHSDHRFALAGLVLAARAPGVRVLQVECIKKTAPGFVRQLIQAGFEFSLD